MAPSRPPAGWWPASPPRPRAVSGGRGPPRRRGAGRDRRGPAGRRRRRRGARLHPQLAARPRGRAGPGRRQAGGLREAAGHHRRGRPTPHQRRRPDGRGRDRAVRVPLLRHRPEARARIAAGEAGPLRLLHGTYLQDWLSKAEDSNWRVDPALGGASRFGDIGVHWCDLMEFVTGHRVTRLTARMVTAFNDRPRRPARPRSAPRTPPPCCSRPTGGRRLGGDQSGVARARTACGSRSTAPRPS